MFGLPKLELKQILQGNLDFIPEIPTLRPNFMRVGIFLSLNFVIIFAEVMLFLSKFNSSNIFLNSIFINLDSLLFTL